MIQLFLVWLSAFNKSLARLNAQINGKWYHFLSNLFAIVRYRLATNWSERGRLDLHNVWSSAPTDGAILPFPAETEFAQPKKDQGEDLFVYGSNVGERTTLECILRRRPIPKATKYCALKDRVEVHIRIDDGQGSIYTLTEQDVVEYSRKEYRACGFAYESLQANRTARIKFRGYLRRNDEPQLVYVRFRFLCLFFNKTLDHQRVFDNTFFAKDIAASGDRICGPDRLKSMLDDYIEQSAHIKGIFCVETAEKSDIDAPTMHFLATVGRRFLPREPVPETVKDRRVVTKIHGFTNTGIGFQLGVVSSNQFHFRYGYWMEGGDPIRPLQNISLTSKEMLKYFGNYHQNEVDYFSSEKICFQAKFANDNGGGEDSRLKNEWSGGHRIEITPWTDNRRLVMIDGNLQGIAFVRKEVLDDEQYVESVAPWRDSSWTAELGKTLVLGINHHYASVVELTGGKGASLARLKRFSTSFACSWTVPNALVVTTSAHRVQINSMTQFEAKLRKLEKAVISRKDVAMTCDDMVQWFSAQELNEVIRQEVCIEMERQFGPDWWEMKFAVRSSSSSEDSAEMSAAGQMSSFLGVKGEAAIVRAILHCWASQWAMVPVEYARAYGQALFSPMAVVVQRMVECEASGVVFTANPVDGDQRLLTVTANFGLGESVVSAASDPDTFQLAVRILSNSYQNGSRSIEGIASRVLGKKTLVTRLTDQDTSHDPSLGIQNETMSEDYAHKQCISDSDLLQLGQICLEIEQHYGNPRDIEWGLVGNRFYLLQSRPITNLDSNFSAYELMHERDTPHMSEHEIYSRAHWGENFPGATSWIAGFFFLGGTQFSQMAVKQGTIKAEDFNPFRPNMGFVSNQLMFNFGTGPFMNLLRGYPKSDLAAGTVLAFFGRHITDPDLLQLIEKFNKKTTKSQSWLRLLMMPFFIAYMVFFGCRKIPKYERELFEQDKVNFVRPISAIPLSDKLHKMFSILASFSYMLEVHGATAIGSSIKTFLMRKMLKTSSTKDEDFDSDINLLLSHCNDVVSAEVPFMLRQIAKSIEDQTHFAKLSDDEALRILQNDQDGKERQAKTLFAAFLAKHGHRGYREFDPLYLPWGKNPIPCVQVIKSLIKGGNLLEARPPTSVAHVIDRLRTQLPTWKRWALQYWFVPWCRDAVGYREHSKSIMIKIQDNLRDAFFHIADRMVEAGILPERDLFFFLRLDEVQRLIGGDRDPTLMMKARQRKRLYPKMDRLKFDEFIKGFRMSAQPEKQTKLTDISEASVSLTGTAVTIGDVRARVCVAERIEEAGNIEAGDILLTYSTDIGWSPYFPLLSGIVTEIGGTISHGAVIAREFGIPCLIAVEDACAHFRTGDIAQLDCATGTITKVG